MDIKFCVETGCYEVAVGTGKRPAERCRPHHLVHIAGDLVRAEVIGDVAITDVRTGNSVGKGGVVELDPVDTSIEQLVYSRFVKVIPAKGEAKAKA